MSKRTKARRCPRPEVLSRAFPEAGAELAAHLGACTACAAEWRKLHWLRELGKVLPVELPDAERRLQVRTELLARAARVKDAPLHRKPRWRLFAAVAAAALVACGVGALTLRRELAASREGPRPPQRATLTTPGATRFAHQGTGGDEVVRLFDGELRVHVEPLRTGERFRVLIGDAEVEVRGTEFTVTARADRLRSVLVQRGLVEVRPRGGKAALLGAGERWPAAAPALGEPARREPEPRGAAEREMPPDAPVEREPLRALEPTVPKPAASAIPPTDRPRSAPRKEGPESTGGAAERAFAAGFQHLKQGRFVDAAPRLEQAAALAPSGSLAEDARFWAAVARARAGQSAEAIQGLHGFLSRHPRSPRAGEAAAALGWLLLRGGRADEAERAFRSALRERAPEVQKSASAGLSAVAAARGDRVP